MEPSRQAFLVRQQMKKWARHHTLGHRSLHVKKSSIGSASNTESEPSLYEKFIWCLARDAFDALDNGVCLFRAFVCLEVDSSGISHCGWCSYWKWCSCSTDRHTQKCLHKVMGTHAQRQTVLGHLVCLFVTVRQSPAGVSAGHWQLNNPHLCHECTHKRGVCLGLKNVVVLSPVPSFFSL